MMNNGTTTEVATVKAGDIVNLSCKHNWMIGENECGVVTIVRKRIGKGLEAYVEFNNNTWVFPINWLKLVKASK